MPDDAYPDTAAGPMSEHQRDMLDEKLRALTPAIPTTPGKYVDSQGDPWELNAAGEWSDKYGTLRDRAYTPIIGIFIKKYGPFLPVTTTTH